MHSGERWRLWHVAVACLLPLVAVIWLAAHRHGLGVTYDSVAYASTRRLVEAGQGWHFAHLWPPGFPAVLGIVGTGAGAVVVNCVAMVANVALCYALAVAVLGRVSAGLGVALWVGLSVSTISTTSMMWSEPLFMVAVDAVLLALVRIHQGAPSGRWLAVVVIACNAACLLRYAGVALVGFAAVSIVWSLWPRRRWASVWIAGAVGAASSVAFGWVAGANIAAGYPATGARVGSVFGVADVAHDTLAAVAQIVLNNQTVGRPAAIGALLVAAGVALAVWLLRGWAVDLRDPIVLLVGWVVVYFGFALYSELATYIDPLDYRLLAPILPAVAVIAVWLVSLRRSASAVLVRTAPMLLAAMAVMSVAFVTTHADVPSLATYRAFYRDLPAQISAVPRGDRIVSNSPHVVAAVTGRNMLVGFPDAGPGTQPDGGSSWVPVIKPRDAEPGDYVVWFGPRTTVATWSPVSSGRGFRIYRVAAS